MSSLKPNQNAYIESFNGRPRDECLNDHWFVSLNHASVVIRAWAKEYNEERPKKALGGLTPAAYARQLAATAVSQLTDSNQNATQRGVTSHPPLLLAWTRLPRGPSSVQELSLVDGEDS